MMELVTCKGRYSPYEPITLMLHCEEEPADTAELVITRLAKRIMLTSIPIEGVDSFISLPAFGEDGACYGVEARILCCEQVVTSVSTAVNIGGNVVRYGFLSDFLPEDDTDVVCLAKYHIDHVQFYDWSYRHDTLVPPTDEFTDMMGKRNNLQVIQQKIAACHKHGMLAMAYGAVYAASRDFWENHRNWGLYAGENKPMIFIDTFYYMDICSPWREHLFIQYIESIERVGFDGIHMDTYGEPKHALSSLGESRDLEQAFPNLIVDTNTALRKAGHTPHLIFNNVGTWPVQTTRDAPQDAVYMELWFPMDRLRHLREAVNMAKPTNKAIVLAAYPTPFRTELPIRALYGELITSFAIALCGATQLFLGENDAVVTQGYYADYTKLLPWQAVKIKAYQDFFVRYQELLFDSALEDVSLTHCGGDNRGFTCDMPYSLEAESNKLWLTFREDGDRKLIGIINLCGNLEDGWNRGKDKPTLVENITLHVLLQKPLQTAWFATPDDTLGSASALACKCTQASLGIDVQLVIPLLDTCALVWL